MHKFLKCVEHEPSLHFPTVFEKAALILESDSSSLEVTSGNHLVQPSVESRWLSILPLSCQRLVFLTTYTFDNIQLKFPLNQLLPVAFCPVTMQC